MYKAVPALPSMGFARSPSYNKMYFNPNIDYKPWPGMEDASWTKADPAPDVNQTLKSQDAIQSPNSDNDASGDEGDGCNIPIICDVIDAIEGLVDGLIGALESILGIGDSSQDIIEPVTVKYAFK